MIKKKATAGSFNGPLEQSFFPLEAYATSLLPPTAMCELVLNLPAPKSSWRGVSELYTLRK